MIKHLKILYLYIIFNIIFLNINFGQEYFFKNYSVSEGLAQSQVYCMLEDSRGFIWLGTQGGGLSRFDGVNFKNFSTRNGLCNDYVLSLFEDDKGLLWIGTQNGISVYNGLIFRDLNTSKSKPISINSIAQNLDGDIFMGTTEGLFSVKNDSLISMGIASDKYINCLYFDTEKRLWIGSRSAGMILMQGEKSTMLEKKNGLQKYNITSVYEDSLSNIWASTYNHGIFKLNNSSKKIQFKKQYEHSKSDDELVFSLKVDSKARQWICTQNAGVAYRTLKDSSWQFLDESDGLADAHVRCLLEDEWGNIWFGTSGGGISKYTGRQFDHYGTKSGVLAQAYSVLEDKDCRIWLGNADRGVLLLEGEKQQQFDRENGFVNTKVKCMYEDKKGRIWLGTEGRGLAMYADSSFRFFTLADGLGGNWIRDIVETKNGEFYVATAGGGISRMWTSTDSVKTHFHFDRLRDLHWPRRVNDLHFDQKGRLWFATENSTFGYFIPKTGFNYIELPKSASIYPLRSLLEDAEGILWLGSGGGGLCRLDLYNKDSLKVQVSPTPLTSNNIYLLLADSYDQLWIGTEKGVDLASLNTERRIINIKHFGRSEGFLGIETCRNAAILDHNEELWFGTIGGLTHFDPDWNRQNPIPPLAEISGLKLSYRPLSHYPKYQDFVGPWRQLKTGLKLSPTDRNISFDFHAINYSNPEQVRYQWRLLGLEQKWSPTSSISQASYANLPAGSYRFQIRAANEDGVWSKVVSTNTFQILLPFWKEWWFIASIIVLALLLIAWIFWSRIQRIRRQSKTTEERLKLEKSVLELEQKALRLQMNPHFIFHILQSIQSLIGKNDTKTARYYLAKFARLMRLVLENSRSNTVSLDDEIQSIENYIVLEQFNNGNIFDYKINISENIETEFIQIPPLMIQPFVENAIIHGLAPLSGRRGMLTLTLELKNEVLHCTLTDNGIGRQVAAQNKTAGHQSTALAVTSERLKLWKVAGDPIAFRDLVENGEAVGTEVRILLPVSG